METDSDALFEFLVGGLRNHLAAAAEYGVCDGAHKDMRRDTEERVTRLLQGGGGTTAA